MFVRDIMSRPVWKIDAGASVSDAARLMAQHDVGALPVCVDDQLVGIVTDRDLVVRCIGRGAAPAETPVRAVMTREPVSIPGAVSVEAAASILSKHGVRRLPVVVQDVPVGMISADDIARFCADDYALLAMQRRLAMAGEPLARHAS